MYGAALAEATNRHATGQADGAHPLALLAPRMTYQTIAAADIAAHSSSPPEPHSATPLARLLAGGGPDATAALLEAAAAFARTDGDGTPSSPGPSGGARGRPAPAKWLAEALQGSAVAAGPEPAEGARSRGGRRGTGPLSPLGHGMFVIPRAAALQVLPEPVAEVLQMDSGTPASQVDGAGALCFPCCAVLPERRPLVQAHTCIRRTHASGAHMHRGHVL